MNMPQLPQYHSFQSYFNTMHISNCACTFFFFFLAESTTEFTEIREVFVVQV
jgi:hypothetical protein